MYDLTLIPKVKKSMSSQIVKLCHSSFDIQKLDKNKTTEEDNDDAKSRQCGLAHNTN